VLAELRHHRHWQSALEHLSGCHFSMLPHMFPSQGMILGGTITLRGHNLTLASFHGINFRSRYWALFNIQHPYILFSTEAQKMEDEGVHIVQDLQFVVGQDRRGAMATLPDGEPVATISKVSRGHIAPQQFTGVREWFSYTFSSIEKGEQTNSLDKDKISYRPVRLPPWKFGLLSHWGKRAAIEFKFFNNFFLFFLHACICVSKP
ncbi:bridge-like lipid transfer protein family member 1, partial [Littorina saxatilis]|uniref:bridge-like lipid transfer protein family member 1 n=1 Tax=Littorina saxatilis TaxID=31220 RepID=UPI0038B4BB96